MADLGRPASQLPSIKCSSCSQEIEIALLMDHVCASKPPASDESATYTKIIDSSAYVVGLSPHSSPLSRQPPSLYDTTTKERPLPAIPADTQASLARRPHPSILDNGLLSPTTALKPTGFHRPGRTAPPRINSTIANSPFLPADSPTPGTSRSEASFDGRSTPATPATHTGSPVQSITRKPTPFQLLVGLPSPRLEGIMDTSNSASQSHILKPLSDPSKTPMTAFASRLIGTDHMYPPASPKPTADVVKRLDALAPGPFTGAFKRADVRTPSPELFRRNNRLLKRQDSEKSDSSDKALTERRPSTSQSQRPTLSRSTTLDSVVVEPASSLQVPEPDVKLARPSAEIDLLLEQLQIDNGLSPIAEDAARKISNASSLHLIDIPSPLPEARKPVPLKLSSMPHRKSKFYQPLLSAGLGPSTNPFQWTMSEEPLVQRMSRGRASSLTGPLSPCSEAMTPPTPMIPSSHQPVIQRTLTSDSIHSISQSSSTVSSHVSAKSSVSNVSSISSKSSWSSIQPSIVRAPSNNDKTLARNKGLNNITDVSTTRSPESSLALLSDLAPPNQQVLLANSPESPLDPSIHWGKIPSQPLATTMMTTPVKPTLDTNIATLAQPAINTPVLQPNTNIVLDESPPPIKPRSPKRQPTQTSPTGPPYSPSTQQPRSKGNCRGCSQPISGKSIRAADGRLTGRYHHACFACKTCARPFPDASFYVHNDSPYCSQHWHGINGSLCRRCNHGIEGSYLETDRKDKFHTDCFSCATCNVQLREDYFEVSGRAYCERHAFDFARRGIAGGAERQARPGPNGYGSYGSNLSPYNGPQNGGYVNPERRRTRLMMM